MTSPTLTQALHHCPVVDCDVFPFETDAGLAWHLASGKHTSPESRSYGNTVTSTVERVRSLYNSTDATVRVRPVQRDLATDAQKNFIRSLCSARNIESADLATLTKRDASALIDRLKATPIPQAPKAAPVTPKVELIHGRVYCDADGTPIKVQENQSGTSMYAKVWDGEAWEYAGKAGLKRIERLLTAEEASAWGHEHHKCVFCSRNLSDERSETAGYGSTCAENYGLPWG